MLLTPLFRPFDFQAGFLTELHALLRAEPVDSLDDFNHLPNGHLACTLTEHHNAAVQTWRHSLLLFFGFGDHRGDQVFPVVRVVLVAEPGYLVREVFQKYHILRF